MKTLLALFLCLGLVRLALADPAMENVQQALKDQGFYYGEITGEKNADTTAAIRRFQIRNGLAVTGELNDETLRSIQSGKSTSSSATTHPEQPAPSAAPPQPVTPAPTPDTSDLRDESTQTTPAIPSPGDPVPQDRRSVPRAPAPAYPPVTSRELFGGTPYEGSPPDVQRSVVVFAQRALARRGLYKNEIDGLYGPGLEFSLRAYQSRVGLEITGRLDLATLAALELLPGATEPVYTPRRRVWRGRPFMEPPPVRGEWIRP